VDRPLCEGLPVLQLSRFYACPSGCDKLKYVRGLVIGHILGTVCMKLVVNFGEEMGEFLLCCGPYTFTEV